MSHELAPPQPTPNELADRLMAEHANTEIQFHGKTMAFGQFVQLRAALCPVKPGELGAASDTEFMVNVLTDSKVELPEEFHAYIRQPESDKPDSNPAVIESNKKSETVITKETSKKDEATAVLVKSSQEFQNNSDSVVTPITKILPEIMARVVQLEIKQSSSKPRVETIEPTVKRIRPESVKEKMTSMISPLSVAAKVESMTSTEMISSETVQETKAEIMATSELPIDHSDLETAVVFSEIEHVESIEINSEDFPYLPLAESSINATSLTFESADFTAEAIPALANEYEFSETAEQSEVYEEIEKSPALATAEFMLQVLPAVTQEVYARVQEMEPEAAAEVAVQIESISIVADRLHVLVLEGNTEGEEAKQIEAYLKREYEQLLVAVGIEPTEEILNDFIRYIYSAEYQRREEINLKELEVIDEGTHEKKLFDEQGVFSRAHAASLNLSRRMDKSIGRLVVNYFSA